MTNITKLSKLFFKLAGLGALVTVLFVVLGFGFITHETCPAKSELVFSNSQPSPIIVSAGRKMLLSKEARNSIISKRPLFGTLFWGRFPFSYDELRKIAGEEYADLLLLQLTNEFLSEGSGVRSILDYGGTMVGKSDSVGMLQVNPLYLLDEKILELVSEYLTRLPPRYRYLSYSSPDGEIARHQNPDGHFPQVIKKVRALVEIIDLLSITAARVQFLKQNGKNNFEKEKVLDQEIHRLKSQGAHLLKGFLGKTLDRKCNKVNYYQPLNVLFALSLNVQHKSLANSFLNSIGITKDIDRNLFESFSNFMTIISYKNGPNYAREMMIHNIGLLIGHRLFHIDLSWQKDIYKQLANQKK